MVVLAPVWAGMSARWLGAADFQRLLLKQEALQGLPVLPQVEWCKRRRRLEIPRAAAPSIVRPLATDPVKEALGLLNRIAYHFPVFEFRKEAIRLGLPILTQLPLNVYEFTTRHHFQRRVTECNLHHE